MSATPYLSGWRYRAVILSIILSAIGYLSFSLWGGWQDVSAAVGKVGLLGVIAALLMSLVNYGLRFIRWQIYLKVLGNPIPWRPSLNIYLAGFALTTTPGKAGEAMRGFLLSPWGVTYPKSLAAFFSERLSDLIAAVLLASIGLIRYPTAWPIILASATLIVIVLIIISRQEIVESFLALLSKKHHKITKPARSIFSILAEIQRCNRASLLITSTSISIIAWSAEALAFHWILQWIGVDIPLEFTIFIYVISMLSGALSFMPGGLGSAEAVMVSLLVWKGCSTADAIAATILIRLTTLWFAVGLGIINLNKFNRTPARKLKT